MSDEITYTQFDSQTYLDSDYELAQEQLTFDWLESIALDGEDIFCDVCGDFYQSDDRCQFH